ncbi:hypothetical protein BSL78_22826 [Apostichopus japonicus]|uniref:Uncharacterized protein n=1 Tax=Stichopus japonicus TaxID=307972 RepID=A0A2G8JX57_STIJA|nr:hypothetical protein BSL78_22826 [Apostichopus japonicus]
MATTDSDRRLTSAFYNRTVNRAATLNDSVVGCLCAVDEQSEGQSERPYYLAQKRESIAKISEQILPLRDETWMAMMAFVVFIQIPTGSSKQGLPQSVTATEQRHLYKNWTQSMTSYPVNKKYKNFQLRERTERQECQNVDETCNKMNRRKCLTSNVIRRRNCRSHSNCEVENLAKKNDVGKFNDLADK